MLSYLILCYEQGNKQQTNKQTKIQTKIQTNLRLVYEMRAAPEGRLAYE